MADGKKKINEERHGCLLCAFAKRERDSERAVITYLQSSVNLVESVSAFSEMPLRRLHGWTMSVSLHVNAHLSSCLPVSMATYPSYAVENDEAGNSVRDGSVVTYKTETLKHIDTSCCVTFLATGLFVDFYTSQWMLWGIVATVFILQFALILIIFKWVSNSSK